MHERLQPPTHSGLGGPSCTTVADTWGGGASRPSYLDRLCSEFTLIAIHLTLGGGGGRPDHHILTDYVVSLH